MNARSVHRNSSPAPSSSGRAAEEAGGEDEERRRRRRVFIRRSEEVGQLAWHRAGQPQDRTLSSHFFEPATRRVPPAVRAWPKTPPCSSSAWRRSMAFQCLPFIAWRRTGDCAAPASCSRPARSSRGRSSRRQTSSAGVSSALGSRTRRACPAFASATPSNCTRCRRPSSMASWGRSSRRSTVSGLCVVFFAIALA